MPEDTKAKEIRFRVSYLYMAQLKLWAHLKGMSVTQLCNNIIQARCENSANRDFIREGVEELARAEGCSYEEMKDRILGLEES